MADLAHDASGPASPEPGGIVSQTASQPTSSDRGKLRVFISYSRDNLGFADQLDAALNACGFECLIDRHDISGGEDWKRRLGDLISEADTVVFVLSPTSALSPICAWEAEEAARFGKRILPVICGSLEGASPPTRLKELNYIYFYEEPKQADSGFGTGLANLITALNTDFDWLREHTRYLQRAMEWDAGDRPTDRLLSGNDILEAKAWASRRPKGAPEPTALQLDFIRASEEEAAARLSEQRKQLEAVAAAQAARETALHEAEEALKQAAEAQRRQAKVRNIALVTVSGLAAVAVLFALLANQQRITAQKQRQQADAILEGATTIIRKIQYQMDSETKHEAYALFQAGAEHGDATSIFNVGVAYQYGLGVTQDYAKAREYYERAAAKAYTGSMVALGLLYNNGLGVPRDYAKAREWYEKAVARDDADAMYTLGLLYQNGQGVPQDNVKAREWLERAAAKDNPDAMYALSLLYHNGQGVPQDEAKAREWLEKAAAGDNAGAMVTLGLLYQNGQGVPQDNVKAREWLERAAAQDNPDAMYALSLLYHNGQGVPQDEAKAREWLEKAAAGDNAGAMVTLGLLYQNGQGVPQDEAKAREWLEKAAAGDNAGAMVTLGLLYQNGQGVPQDNVKAREWLERAAAQDNPDAMYALSLLYHNGQGVPRDEAKAREWLEKAAAGDNAGAMYTLGLLYQNGQGVPQDHVKAREWLEKAAAKDNAGAMFLLSALYHNGQGVAQDEAKAREWLEKAAARDNVDAMVTLGELYESGQGVPQDDAKAREWYEKAADKGDPSAKISLEQLTIHEAETAGRYDEALRLEDAAAANVEAVETKRDGKPGEQTEYALRGVSWFALFAKDFTKALAVANRAHALFPDDLGIESNRAHALMFLGYDEEAKALYLAHKGEPDSKADNLLWQQVIAEDFAKLRKAGLMRPMMAKVEKELGVSR